MRKVFLFTLIIAALSLQTGRVVSQPLLELPTGVKLTYRVVWLGIRAGTGIIEIGKLIENGGKYVIPVRSCISTSGLVRVFLRVDDCLWSELDPKKLTPFRFRESISEVKYRRETVIEFDREENIARIFRPEGGGMRLKKEVAIEDDYHDFISWPFYLSTQELEKGQTYTFKVLTYNSVDETSLQVKEEKLISMPKIGKIRAFRLIPAGETDESLKKKGGAGEVWVDSKSRLPLVITMKIPQGGSFKLVLEKKEWM